MRNPSTSNDAAPALQFGVATPVQVVGRDATTLLAEIEEMVRLGEELRFDLCLTPEHHECSPNGFPNSLTVASWLLARTDTIAVGTGIALLPLHHPVAIAEHTAFLQRASGNRFLLGVGAAYQQADFEIFEIDPAQQVDLFERGLQRIRESWSSKPDAWQVAPSMGVPAPILVGASSTRGVQRAARLGDGWIANPVSSLVELDGLFSAYRAECRARDTRGHTLMLRNLWVDESDKQAMATFARPIESVFKYYQRRGATVDGSVRLDRYLANGDLSELVTCGSPETVVDDLIGLFDRYRPDGFVLALRFPLGPDHAAVLRCLRLLASDVIPKVRDHAAKTSTGLARDGI